MTTYNAALIGVGMRAVIGPHLAEARPGSTVRYAVDPTPAGQQRARELFGDVATFASVTELLAAVRPDVAIVTSPDDTHAAVAVPLLEAGVPVYLEKPMEIDVPGADRLLDAVERTGTLLYVGHNMRHMSVVTTMRQAIDDGLIGAVQAVWVRHFVGHGGDFYFHDWHAERARAGTLLLQKGVHDIDVVHALAGAPSELVVGIGALQVYGDVTDRRDNTDRQVSDWFSMDTWPPRSATGLNPVIDVEDLSMIQMRLTNGVLASYQQCHFTPDYWRNYTVIGDAGRLENFGDAGGGTVRVWNRRHDYPAAPDLELPIADEPRGHDAADRRTMAEFLDAVEGRVDVTANPYAARNAVAAATAGATSIRTGSVPVPVAVRVP